MFQVTIKPIEDKYILPANFEINKKYNCVDVKGDQLLIINEEGDFLSIYARRCKFIRDIER